MKSCCDEYCANYGCNQGRDCPVRATPVAKVGQRMPAAEPLPRATWRDRLGGICYVALAAVGALLCAVLVATGWRL